MSKLNYKLLEDELRRAVMQIRAGGRANKVRGSNALAGVISARRSLEAPKSGIHFTRPTGTYKCGELIANFDDGTLQYGDNEPIEFSQENREAKLLYLLMGWGDKVIVDEIIVERLQLKGQQARDIQFIMRDLKKPLRRAGMSKAAIEAMFFRKKSRGYKLVC